MTQQAPRMMHGTLWSYAQNWSARGLSLLVFFILARLLSPEDFGAFAVSTVLITLGELFVEQGFAPAIVQRENLEERHVDSAFWASLFIGIVFALVVLVSSDKVAELLGNKGVGKLLIGLCPIFVLMGISGIPAARLRRRLDYQSLTRRTALANISSGIGAIVAASLSAGVWTFVIMQLLYYGVGALVLWRNEPWRPTLRVDLPALRDLVAFSSKMLVVRSLEFVETRVVELVVAATLGLPMLGQYSLANRAYQALTQLLAAPLWEALSSSYARMQNDRSAISAAYGRAADASSYMIAPVFLIMGSLSPVLIPVVFGRQWHEAVLVFQFFALIGFLRVIPQINIVVLQAIGLAGTVLQLSLLRTAATVGGVLLLIHRGIEGVAAGLLIGQLAMMPLSYYLVGKKSTIDIRSMLLRQLNPTLVSLLSAGVGFLTIRAIGNDMKPLFVLSGGLLASFGSLFVLVIFFAPGKAMESLSRLPPAIRKPLAAATRPFFGLRAGIGRIFSSP